MGAAHRLCVAKIQLSMEISKKIAPPVDNRARKAEGEGCQMDPRTKRQEAKGAGGGRAPASLVSRLSSFRDMGHEM